jgi:hypothetical protein
MNPLTTLRVSLLVLLMAVIAAGEDKTPPSYQQGTILKNYPSSSKSCDLREPVTTYRISNCGDLQAGQVVEFRVDNAKIYIRQENGKEHKCGIEATMGTGVPLKYEKGTILGWSTRVDITTTSSMLGRAYGIVGSHERRTRVYELKSGNLIYQIDDCGSDQAGQFTAGQEVGYRVFDSDQTNSRIFVNYDNGKQYSCKMEGVRAVDGAKPDAPPTAASPTAQ